LLTKGLEASFLIISVSNSNIKRRRNTNTKTEVMTSGKLKRRLIGEGYNNTTGYKTVKTSVTAAYYFSANYFRKETFLDIACMLLSTFTTNKQTPWPESASELYRPSDRSLSAKLLPIFVDRGCHVVSVTDENIKYDNQTTQTSSMYI
jgi:hypothetical protein